MKKTLLCLVALLLSVTAVNAQVIDLNKKSPVRFSVGKSNVVAQPERKAKAAPSRISLDADERIMGFYTTDELPSGVGDPQGGIGIPTLPGNYEAGAIFSSDEVGAFVGGEITKVRFALATSVGASCVHIYPCVQQGSNISIGSEVAAKEVASTQAGWNDVILDTPVRIEENTLYLISYDYTQNSTDYPLLADGDVCDYISGVGFLVYGNLGGGEMWNNQSQGGFGNLCVQAVVKGANIIDNDMAISNLSLDKGLYNNGETATIAFSARNVGENEITSYTLDIAIDGTTVNTLDTPIALTGNNQTITANISLAGLESGVHELTVTVKTINGTTPTENTSNDNVSADVRVYSEALQRQMSLVEEFTSTECPYCPLGHSVLDALKDVRNDLAVAVLHNSYPGVSSLMTDETDLISQILCSGYINPSLALNRYYVDDSSINQYGIVALPSSYQEAHATQAAQMFSEIIDMSNNAIPSLATVDIATVYDETSRKLDITVSGDLINNFSEIFDGGTLTVYVTEDNIVARQNNYGSMDYNYVHNDVVRSVVSEVQGDELELTGANAYSNTYSITLDNSWNAENMHVIAFISKSIAQGDARNYYVTNANLAKVGGNSTGISGVVTPDENATEVARYALDGTQLSAPTKGINIIKMSDGTTRKVIVK